MQSKRLHGGRVTPSQRSFVSGSIAVWNGKANLRGSWMGRSAKILWQEGKGELHSARGQLLAEGPPGFFRLKVKSGQILLISTGSVVKVVEEAEADDR
jgi:hypothetical protein